MKKLTWIFLIMLSACNLPFSTTEDVSLTGVATELQPAPTFEASPAQIKSLPAGPVTMVALGDSLTQGDGDESGRGYPGRLLDKVNENRPGSTMTNLGQSGWNSDALINGDQGLESQLNRAVIEIQTATSQGRAAVALVWIGSNDLWYLYEYGGEGSDEGDAQDAQHFSANMDRILAELRGAGAGVVVALLDDQSQRPIALKGEAFTAITKEELLRMSLQAQKYNQIIRERAAQHDALTVDFYNTDIFINPATLYDDGNHPNPAGYDVIAQKWYEALTPLLQ